MLKSRLLGAVGIVAVMGGIAAVSAQTPASPAFDVATVKHSRPDATGMLITGPRPGSFATQNAPLERIIMYAFGMREEQLAELPSWARTERFDIVGKYPPGQNTPNPQDVSRMVQALLTERFHIQTHTEMREGATFDLVLARHDGRLGPRLKQTDFDCAKFFAEQEAAGKPVLFGGVGEMPPCMAVTSDRFIKMSVRKMDMFAGALARQVGRPVFDRTGLTGNYEFNMEWTPGLTAAPTTDGASAAATPDDSVSLFTALEEQLGLKLESSKGPIDVLVIDHVEHPTAD